MRLALGAGRTRVVCQLLTESILLALIGGAVGLLVATWAAQALKAFMPPAVVPVTVDLTLDGPVLLFALAASLGAAVLFGLFPALQAVNPELVPALKDQAAFAVRGVQTSGVRSALVVAQVALSLVLLIGTGLFLKSLRNASSIDPGFKPQNMLLASINIGIPRIRRSAGPAISSNAFGANPVAVGSSLGGPGSAGAARVRLAQPERFGSRIRTRPGGAHVIRLQRREPRLL